MTKHIQKSDAEWREQLTPEQYRVTRQKGTERAFTGEYADCKTAGIYTCVCCGAPLFDSATKYDSCTGWPSFWAPIEPANIEAEIDNSWFMRRTEIQCASCGAQPADDLVELRWFERDELPPPDELAFTHYPDVLRLAVGYQHP